MNSKRIESIDSLKGIVIFLVIWGHSIQYLRADFDFFHNPIFEFIYSFHMPLFFLISGFFFSSSLKLGYKEFLQKKIIQLLLPCFIWALIFISVDLIYGGKFNWLQSVKILINPYKWPFWFLRELFVSYFLLYFSFKILKKKLIVFILCICFVAIAPKCGMQRFLFPIFLVGVLLKDNYQFCLNHFKLILSVSGFIFFICLFFWDGNYTIYVAGFPRILRLKSLNFDFTNIDISFFRLIIGLSGSVFWFFLFQKLVIFSKVNFYLEKIGTLTLSLYILQVVLLEKIVSQLVNFSYLNLWIYSLVITPLISLFILIICIWLTFIIFQSKTLSLLLFGSVPKTNKVFSKYKKN